MAVTARTQAASDVGRVLERYRFSGLPPSSVSLAKAASDVWEPLLADLLAHHDAATPSGQCRHAAAVAAREALGR